MRNTLLSGLVAAVVIASCPALVSPAEARTHHDYRYHHRHHYNHYHHAHHRSAASRRFTACNRRHCGRSIKSARVDNRGAYGHALHSDRHSGGGSLSLGSVGGALASKAHEIVSGCGSMVISGYRPGARIAGTRHASMHASGRAVDIRGNPQCIYSHLHGWSGGYSIDYASVQHVHISLGGHEDGLRFAHNSSHRRHHRHHRG